MYLSPTELRTLKALKKDPLLRSEIEESFDLQAANNLVANGLAQVYSGIYTISLMGRKQLLEVRENDVRVTGLSSKKIETISSNQLLNIAELSTPQAGVFSAKNHISKKGKSMSEIIENHTKKDIVDLVIAKNQIDKFDLYGYFPKVNHKGKKKIYSDVDYLNRNKVLKVDENGLVRIGELCNEWLGNQKKVLSTASDKTKISPEFLSVEPEQIEDKSQACSDAPIDFKLTESPASKKFSTRFALTSDNTLMIIDSDKTIEFDVETTNRLFDFIDSICLIETHGHVVGGAVL